MQAVGEGSRREALRLVESLGLHNLIAQARPPDDDARRETRERSLGLSVSDARAALAVVPGEERFAAEKAVYTSDAFSEHGHRDAQARRTEEHTSDLQSRMSISYAVYRLTTRRCTHYS